MKESIKPSVIYARVSTKEQEKEGFSIPAQLRLLREYAEKNGLNVVEEFTDSETAKKTGRTNFGRMLAFMKKHPKVKIILVEKTDRLYRNFKDYVALDDMDLEIHLVKENEILSRDSRSHQKFIHGIKVLMAKNYIDNLREEVKKGMREKAERGDYPSCAPVGYINNPQTRLIEPDPKNAHLIQRIFELYATGLHSCKSIAEMMVMEGFYKKRPVERMSPQTIYNILSNPVYKGDFIWDKKYFQGKHEPIVSRELWDLVQEAKKDKQRKPIRPELKFAYTGMLRCGKCGCSIVAESKKGGRYTYYHCSHSRGKCGQGYITEKDLEKALGPVVKAITIDAERMEWIREALQGSHADKKAWQEREIQKLRAEQDRLKKNLGMVYDDRLSGAITPEFWREKSDELRDRLGKVEEKIAAHETANFNYFDDGIRLLELANGAYKQWLKRDSFDKAKLLKILSSNLVLDEGTITPTYRKPFDLIAKAGELAEQKEGATCEKLPPRQFW